MSGFFYVETFSAAITKADDAQKKILVQTLREKFEKAKSKESKKKYLTALMPYLKETEINQYRIDMNAAKD